MATNGISCLCEGVSRTLKYRSLQYIFYISRAYEIEIWLQGGITDYGDEISDILSTPLFPRYQDQIFHVCSDLKVFKFPPVRLFQELKTFVLEYIECYDPPYLIARPATFRKTLPFLRGMAEIATMLPDYELHTVGQDIYLIRVRAETHG